MPKFQKFNNGIVDIYEVKNAAEKGDRKKDKLFIRYHLRFAYNTIGVKRNFEAAQAQVDLTELISTPLHRDISSQDVAIINSKQYRIAQVQHKTDTLPPTSLISLSRLEADYEITGI